MNQKKKVFNFKLYLQSFKQMKIIGIISSIVFLLLSIMIPVSRVIEVKRDLELGYSTTTRVVYNVLTQNSFLFLTFVIMTPLLTLFMWNFLTKRNTSDFYHSLPYTRLCMYLSDLAAIISWQLVIIVSCAICSSVIFLFNQSSLIVDFGLLYRTYLIVFICNLLVTGAISLACMLTGTMFSNICVAGLILFFPRLLMLIINNILLNAIPFCVSEHTIPLIGQNSNIVSSLVFSIITYYDDTNIVLSITGGIYTFVLALIYLVIAGVLFVYRQSEAAGKGAITGKLQFIIRAVIGAVVGSFGVMGIIGEIRSNYPDTTNIIFSIIITAIVAALLIMVYECINSKSIRGTVKSIPSILFSYGIAVVFFLIMTLSMNGILSFRPTPDSIKSVSFSNANKMYRNRTDYFEYCSSQIVINEPHVKEILCNALNSNLDVYDQNNLNEFTRQNNVTELQVTFRTGGLPKYRTVYVTQKQFNELGKYLQEIKEYKETFLDLPSSNNVSMYWDHAFGELTAQEGDQLYDCLIKESKEISFEDWYANLHSGRGNLMVDIEFMRDGHPYCVTMNVSDKLPETIKLNFRFANEKAMKSTVRNELVDVLKSYSDQRYLAGERVSLQFYDPVSQTVNDTSILELLTLAGEKGPETVKKLGEAVENLKSGDQIELNRPYVIVRYFTSGNKNATTDEVYDDYEKYKDVSCVIQLDDYDLITDYYPVKMGK